MDLSLLETLETKLHEATRFSDVWDYFLTHFGEDEEFMALGERAGDPFLENILAQVGAQLFGRQVVVVENLALIRIPEYDFIHGSARIEGRPTSVMYFENIHKGLLAVIWAPGSGETKLVRFTGRALYDGL